jgi:hypothetical protein
MDSRRPPIEYSNHPKSLPHCRAYLSVYPVCRACGVRALERAVTVCRVLTLRLVVLGKSCDFSDEILRTRAMDPGQFELGACRLDAQSRMQFREGCPPGPCLPRWPRSWSPPCRPRMLIRKGLRAVG